MVEAGVDHAVRRRRTPAQRVQVREVAAMRFRPGGEENRGTRVRPGEAEHPVARGEQVGDDRGADEAGRPGEEYAHGSSFH